MPEYNPSESVNFDRAVDFYDETRGFPPGVELKVAELIAQAGDITPRSRVLEIGIGTGRIAIPLANYAKAIFGADISLKMMSALRNKLNKQPIYVAQADASRLPYPENIFDSAVVVHVFHLVADLPGVIAELKRVLKPEAKLVHCFNRDDKSFRELVNSWRDALGYDMTKRWDKVDQALPAAGWSQIGTSYAFDYTKQNSPTELIELYRKRTWSATWNLSDEQLEKGLELMNQYVRTHYNDPTQPITVTHTFNATAFQSPK